MQGVERGAKPRGERLRPDSVVDGRELLVRVLPENLAVLQFHVPARLAKTTDFVCGCHAYSPSCLISVSSRHSARYSLSPISMNENIERPGGMRNSSVASDE